MKIAVVADCHLNRKNYKGVMDRDLPDLPFRNVDFMKSFDFICDQCINKLHPDLMVIAGDIYDHFDPSNEVRGYLSSRLRKLTKANIPLVILIGNHDVCRKDHALKGLQELGLKSIKIVDKPTTFNFKGKKLLLFPYSIDIERQNTTTKKLFNEFVSSLSDADIEDSLFFGHVGVNGATISEYNVTKVSKHVNMENLKRGVVREFVNNDAADISLKDLQTIPAKYIFLGDYHRFQILPVQGRYAMYTGSIEKSDFSEINQKKGFVIYDDKYEEDVEMGCSRFIEYPSCRPMLELRGNLEDMQNTLKTLDLKKYKGSVVKMTFIGNASELFHFTSRLDFLKKDIRNKINPVHMFHKQNVIDEEQQQQAFELEEEIIEKGHMGVEEIINIIKEIITEKVKNDKQRTRTIVLAETIYDEVCEEQK